MPHDASGNYVPLTQYQKDEIGQYIGGVLRREPDLNFFEAAVRIGTRFHVDQSDTFELIKIVRGERDSNALGVGMTVDPTYTPEIGDLPTIPYDPEDAGRVVTNIVVQITNNNTGEVTTSNEQWISTGPVSEAAIAAEINSDLSAYLATMGTAPSGGVDVEDLTVVVIILGVFVAA